MNQDSDYVACSANKKFNALESTLFTLILTQSIKYFLISRLGFGLHALGKKFVLHFIINIVKGVCFTIIKHTFNNFKL